MPSKRWGHACVEAHGHLIVIGGYEGQYLGDIWKFSLDSFTYEKTIVVSKDSVGSMDIDHDSCEEVLKRSNHSAVFYAA